MEKYKKNNRGRSWGVDKGISLKEYIPDKCVKRYLHYKAGCGEARKNVFGIINKINICI